MAEQIGIVTQTEQKGMARVVIQRTAGCSGCLVNPSTQGCRTCGSGGARESRVANPIGARSGDLVRVHMDSVNFFKGAAIIYLLPIAFMLLGALAVSWAGASMGWQENASAIGGGLIGLAMGVVLAMGLDRFGRFGRDWTPSIRQILVACDKRGDRMHNMCDLQDASR